MTPLLHQSVISVRLVDTAAGGLRWAAAAAEGGAGWLSSSDRQEPAVCCRGGRGWLAQLV